MDSAEELDEVQPLVACAESNQNDLQLTGRKGKTKALINICCG